MATHRRFNDTSDHEGFWPLDEGVSTDGCPECEAAIRSFLHHLEIDLRVISLDLWTAGWTPTELLAEVRRSTDFVEAATFMAHVLLIDDSHRSEQARPTSWCAEIEALRAQTGISDVDPGWLTRWIVDQRSASRASSCLKAVLRTLGDLVAPSAA